MRPLRFCAALLVLLAASASLTAQREKRQPLTEAQVDKIREAGIYPAERIRLYTQFLDEHADTIKGLINRAKSAARGKRIDDELLDFTALIDELSSNLDQYGERKADMRSGLKKLNEACPKWLNILRILPGEPAFDEARKEAIEAGEDLSQDAKRLLDEQTTYFDTHKEARGQEREEQKEAPK